MKYSNIEYNTSKHKMTTGVPAILGEGLLVLSLGQQKKHFVYLDPDSLLWLTTAVPSCA
jgi:hypothetical protein